MSKSGSNNGSGSTALPVGCRVLQIALPLDLDGDRASDTASTTELNRDQTSGATTPTGTMSDPHRKWYSLYDKIYALENLIPAWLKVEENKGAAGSDGVTIERFAQNVEAELTKLREQLRQKKYRPRPVRRKLIPKTGGGMRKLGIPAVRDRVVQQALLQVLGPIFEAKFSDLSHGFRPGRGCATALSVLDEAVFTQGCEYVADADIRSFFDTVDHDILLAAVNEEIADGSVLNLIRAFLESGIRLDDVREVEATEIGTPQGGPISPLLANIYLHPLDVAMAEAGFKMIRYADDFVIVTKRREQAEEALALAQQVLDGLKLQLHPEKTRVAAIDKGFAFLGYQYLRYERKAKSTKRRKRPGTSGGAATKARHPRRKGEPASGDGAQSSPRQKVVSDRSRQRFRDAIRQRTPRHAGQKKPKAKHCVLPRLKKNKRLQAMISDVNKYIRGWHWYFKNVRTNWKDYFKSFDEFIRRRLRCAITGRYANGVWNERIRIEAFNELGLLSAADLQKSYEAGLLAAPPNSGQLAGAVCGSSARTVRTGRGAVETLPP